jgi:hypothetical protein
MLVLFGAIHKFLLNDNVKPRVAKCGVNKDFATGTVAVLGAICKNFDVKANTGCRKELAIVYLVNTAEI